MMKKNKKGFTIVEVTLAMVFISIILISIAWLTIHISSVYEKGLAMKAVNSTAKELIDDFSRAISTSPARTVESICSSKYDSVKPSKAYTDCVNDSARKFSYQQRYGSITIKNDSASKFSFQQQYGGGIILKKNGTKEELLPTNGVFCTGRYSYIWNTAYVLNTDDYTAKLDYKARFNKLEKADKSDFRLIKVSDYNKVLCSQHMRSDAYAYDANNTYDISYTPEVNSDMLDNTENNLAIYEFTIFSPAVHRVTSAAFYSGTFVLATLRGSININTNGDFCSEPPDNLNTDFAYCAINKFNFAMRAAGEKAASER
ncbi:hypothetical protein J6X90_00080 [Candidatus Saccharibacteria bacterium]|nr:hypothetical protein [Candidatus Saccharibacteria bacterium]